MPANITPENKVSEVDKKNQRNQKSWNIYEIG